MRSTRADIPGNVARIRSAIADAARRAGRSSEDVTLVAAAKRVSASAIEEAVAAGVTAIGENYVTELRAARSAVAAPGIRWHYIGALRSGTAHHVADLADVVETVAGERAARRLAGRAERAGRRLDVLLEVDFTGERTGLAPGELGAAASVIGGLDGLRLRGLMTVPPLTPTAEEARPWFARLRELREGLAPAHPAVLDLSMGMSLDYEVAVEEGATMVRIGTALFGPRTP
ncbi:MAG: YggS family pyridoxal phosphate-dependent enzyme [Actinomycetota bacterium]